MQLIIVTYLITQVEKQLMKCLNDKDRLVRESGCLALGHMKSQQAVPKLVQLWYDHLHSLSIFYKVI